MYGRNFMGVERTTFLIREDGTIGTIWQKVKVSGHAESRARSRAELCRNDVSDVRSPPCAAVRVDAIRATDLDMKTALAQETATRWFASQALAAFAARRAFTGTARPPGQAGR